MHVYSFYSEVPPTCLCIVTELCEDGTLRDWLKKNTKPNTREKKKVIKIFEEVCDECIIVNHAFVRSLPIDTEVGILCY